MENQPTPCRFDQGLGALYAKSDGAMAAKAPIGSHFIKKALRACAGSDRVQSILIRIFII